MSAGRVVLLGPQKARPTAGEVLRELGVTGPVATVTAGWQEWESDDRALREQLGVETRPLALYARAERVWEADPELREAHRRMQLDGRGLQGLYRRRLAHAGEAWIELLGLEEPDHLLGPERDAALRAIQELDARHLQRLAETRADFDARVRPLERASVAREREEIERDLADAAAVVIEGGHAAVLLNRLVLFGVPELLAGKVVVGCAAGAMVLTSRVFLYDDTPALGRGHAELGLPGLGLVRGVVALPSAGERLRVGDAERMRRLARRVSPDECALLEPGDRLDCHGDRLDGTGTRRLRPDGTLSEWGRAA